MNAFDGADNDTFAQEDVPPDGGYGWICVAACFTVNCFTWGTVSVSTTVPEGGMHSIEFSTAH